MGEKTLQGLALDTSVCIEIIKGRPLPHHLRGLSYQRKVFLPSVSLFELLLRTYNLQAIGIFLSGIELLPFDQKAAVTAALLFKELKNKGTLIELADVFIAATAIANNCELATLNIRDFQKIKGLKLVKI